MATAYPSLFPSYAYNQLKSLTPTSSTTNTFIGLFVAVLTITVLIILIIIKGKLDNEKRTTQQRLDDVKGLITTLKVISIAGAILCAGAGIYFFFSASANLFSAFWAIVVAVSLGVIAGLIISCEAEINKATTDYTGLTSKYLRYPFNGTETKTQTPAAPTPAASYTTTITVPTSTAGYATGAIDETYSSIKFDKVYSNINTCFVYTIGVMAFLSGYTLKGYDCKKKPVV